MSDTYDLLVIIAGEDGRLSADDRHTIRQAAEHLRQTEARLDAAVYELAQANRLVEALRREADVLRVQQTAAKWSMSTGWVTVQMRDDGRMAQS